MKLTLNILCMQLLYIATLVFLWITSESKRSFPAGQGLNLVDRKGENYSNTMVTKTKLEKRKVKKCSAEGTGRARLKVLYQNGGNITHTHKMLEQIEGMLDSVRPHCFFMAEN